MILWIMIARSTVTSDRLLVGMIERWMNSNHPLATGLRSGLLVHEIVIINNGAKGLGALKRESHFVTIPHN